MSLPIKLEYFTSMELTITLDPYNFSRWEATLMADFKINPKTGLRELTKKQQIFVDAYMKTFSIMKATEAAGYNTYTNGKRAFELPHVQAVIEERKRDYLEQLGYSKERVIAELCKQSFSNIADFVEWSSEWDEEQQRYFHRVNVKDSSQLDASVIKAVKINRNGHMEIDMYDKQVALEKLCKMLGLNAADKLEVTGANGGAIQIDDFRRKLEDQLNRLSSEINASEEVNDTEQSD